MKRRPSGAKAMAVGFERPVANCDSVKPLGNVAAETGERIFSANKSVSAASNEPRRRAAFDTLRGRRG
jgi:hypothetical protein